MLALATMTRSGVCYLDGEGLDGQWIRESSMTHLVAVLIFFALWKLHRFLGKTLFDDIVNLSLLFFVTQEAQTKISEHDVASANEVHQIKSTCGEESPEEDDLLLQKKVPDSTFAERLRFFEAKGNNVDTAAKSLQEYLDWRKQYSQLEEELDYTKTGDEDLDHWKLSTLLTYRLRGVKSDVMLPQFVRTYKVPSSEGDLLDNRGARVFHVTPGQIDERICSTPTYATALAIYMDRKLSRESTEQICVVLDVRGGLGWRNLNAANQLPFIQHTCKLLLQMFPERLSRAIVYPIPASFIWLWNIASRCIDVKTRNKIAVLKGPATIEASPPTEQMIAYMSHEAADRLETARVASFIS